MLDERQVYASLTVRAAATSISVFCLTLSKVQANIQSSTAFFGKGMQASGL
ncbi:hypothetical protein KQI74_13645 [Paenibacillus barcinonensis]|uniref:hypothetical protein n=1 Tax=Paenibacillus barcinonensis TaxID=198119 RepID=UPI001C0F4074|nr:hypothetical protein [Paenibacillus barcinonensis]MBU5353335.1 hypothetical protein [Paenibacillus barcinonensis]